MNVRQLISILEELDAKGHGDLPVLVEDGLDPSDPIECTCASESDGGLFYLDEHDNVQYGPHIRLS